MKKNMRKVAALGLCVALGATMLTACGGSKGESASGGKTELNLVSGMRIRDRLWRKW